MNRYFKAFLLAMVLYVALIASYIYVVSNKDIQNKSAKKSLQRVKVTILTMCQVQKKTTQEVKKEEVEVSKPKLKPKPEIKPLPKPKPKPKKVVKKKTKKVINKKVKKRCNKTRKKQKYRARKQIKRSLSTSNIGVNTHTTEIVDTKKQRYYTLVKRTIAKNKRYPRSAIRRGMQGVVKVRFVLSPNGELLQIKSLNGNKIFYNSIKEAIQRSFPLAPPPNLFYENIEISFDMVYKLR